MTKRCPRDLKKTWRSSIGGLCQLGGLPTSGWKNLKIEERTTDYGSALFAFKSIEQVWNSMGQASGPISLNLVAQFLFPVLNAFTESYDIDT